MIGSVKAEMVSDQLTIQTVMASQAKNANRTEFFEIGQQIKQLRDRYDDAGRWDDGVVGLRPLLIRIPHRGDRSYLADHPEAHAPCGAIGD